MKKYLLSILCAFFLLSGCNYLDMVPEKDIETIETIFEKRDQAEAWWMGLYGDLMTALRYPKYSLPFLGSDEFVSSPKLYDGTDIFVGSMVANGLQMSQEPYGNIWYPMYIVIRNANTFLDHIDGTYNMTEEERNWRKADVKAVKAFTYFELLRTYGPICLVPENQPVDLPVEAYQLPRQHVDTCFKEIIRLLDEAEPNIPTHAQRVDRYGFTFTKEAIAALKARVLLYAASPLFNGNKFYSDFKNKNGEPLFSSAYDREKWKLAAEAADKAADICMGSRDLARGAGDKKTKLLNYMDNIEQSTYSKFDNKEFLLEWKGGPLTWTMYTLPRLLGDNNYFDPSNKGCLSPSMKMVEMYYTANGLPIDADLAWTNSDKYKLKRETDSRYEDVVALNTDILYLHMRREPRFYATIAGDRMYWQRGKNTLTVNNNLLVTPYKGEKLWGTDQDAIISRGYQNVCGYWLKKYIYSWIPTQYYSTYLENIETTAVIRLAEVYLMQAEAWNEYLEKPDTRVYEPLDKVRERAGILPVRDAWRIHSTMPGKVDTKEGMREIIQRENNIEFAFEGHRYWNMRRWLIAHQEMNGKNLSWNVLGTKKETFYNEGKAPEIEVGRRNKFVAPRDYFAPIKVGEIITSGMVQNPGW